MSSLTGLSPNNPRDYVGPNVALNTVVTRNRAPTGADYRQPETGKLYPFNTFWLVGKNPTTGTQGDLWYLSKIVANVAYWIQLNEGSATPVSIMVQANTAPGVNPVLPTVGGLINVNGAIVINHAVPIETRTRALNTFNVEVQYATSSASTTANLSGLAHFNNADFTVDANGFVSLAGGGGGSGINVVQTQTITATGTYTPTAGTVYAQFEIMGGGGGGGGVAITGSSQFAQAGGGGGGEYALGVLDAATIGAGLAITIGAGGAGGVAGNNTGTTGGTTSVAGLITALGGAGGVGSAASAISLNTAGGLGGSGGTGGAVRFRGDFGGNGYASTSDQLGSGGYGAAGKFSGGVPQNGSTGAAGSAGSGYGGGGSGASNKGVNVARAGGSGTSGIVFITEYIVM